MELKPYQQLVIKDLENYLLYVQKHSSPAKAFNEYWKDRVGEYKPSLDGSFEGMRPYKDNVQNAAHIAIKVPTAGGKTFIACNALHTIDKTFNQGNTKAVVWLVPWSNLLQQTVANLSNPNHPYREKLNTLFSHRVGVYEKDQLLQGANFNPTTVTEQLNIFVFNFSSLRINARKKDDRKVFQENGALEPFRNTIVDPDLVLPDTDETALINVIRSLNPIVIVDESHNAESDLSVEMLQNLNPSLILDLTATPKKNSNIISYVNAIALKKEHMVKLPVMVYNHHKRMEVITSALHLRQKLEILAKKEETETGLYIRPIILFQAQSNIKGKNNTTFQKIKDELIKLKIPEEQIKIKVSGNDELKDIDLSAKDCPVRYIITVNALKEGWDCPNAYILASLADKSSAVDVEQILGRVLRQPFVQKHNEALLNLSFVLTASSKFQETLDNIVKGLQESGFSSDDYYAEELPEPDLTDNEILQTTMIQDLSNTLRSDEDFAVEAIEFDPNASDETEDSDSNFTLSQITNKAVIEAEIFEEKIQNTEIDETTAYFTEVMKTQPKKYQIDTQFLEKAQAMKLPQFFRKVDASELSNDILFDELKKEDLFLNKDSLLDGFRLSTKDTNIDFDESSADVFMVDYNEKKKTATKDKVQSRAKDILMKNILAKPKEGQIIDISNHIVSKLGDMTPISQQELKKYVARIFDDLTPIQVQDIVENEFVYIQKIKNKIKQLTQDYSKQQFQMLLDSNEIFVKDNFVFSDAITSLRTSTPISKSLYQREADMNNFEQEMILEIASLENIVFWHRNLERGKGFYLNGYNSNHYPDFILLTKNGTIIIIETKGDHLDNDDSADKNKLGQKWAEKAGENYKYFMVFQTKDVSNTYTARTVLDVIKKL